VYAYSEVRSVVSQPKCHQIELFSWILDDGRAPATGIRRVNLEPTDGYISPVSVRSALLKVAGYPGNFPVGLGAHPGFAPAPAAAPFPLPYPRNRRRPYRPLASLASSLQPSPSKHGARWARRPRAGPLVTGGPARARGSGGRTDKRLPTRWTSTGASSGCPLRHRRAHRYIVVIPCRRTVTTGSGPPAVHAERGRQAVDAAPAATAVPRPRDRQRAVGYAGPAEAAAAAAATTVTAAADAAADLAPAAADAAADAAPAATDAAEPPLLPCTGTPDATSHPPCAVCFEALSLS